MAYQQRGARREDLVAGLAFSIATNYLNRVVRERTVGDCIFFQGGTAYNDAVAAAFSQILDKEIIVPPHNGVIGALGMALLAQRAHGAHRRADPLPRLGPRAGRLHRRRLRLQGAAPTSATCGSSRSKARRPTGATSAPTATASRPRSTRSRSSPTSSPSARSGCWRRTRRRASACPSRAPHGRHPAQHVHLRPAAVLGDVLRATWAVGRVLSPESDRGIRAAGVELTVAEPCFPIRVAHGHVQWLVEQGVDYVFVPNVDQRGDGVRAVQLARLPLGADAALRGAHGAGARGRTATSSSRRACASATGARAWCATCADMGEPARRHTGPAAPGAASAPPTAQERVPRRAARAPAARRSPRSRRPASSASCSSAGRTTCTTRASTWTSRASCASSTGST